MGVSRRAINDMRFPAIATSDCTQPVEPKGNPGCAGERNLQR